MSYKLIIASPADAEDVAFVRKNLHASNQQQLDRQPVYRRFAITAQDDSGAKIGGIVAEIFWDWLFIELLWVGEQCRGSGIGKALLERAEQEALSDGITRAHTSTASFQARAFYEKCGYTVFGELEESPLGHSVFFMKKRELVVHPVPDD